MSVFAGDTTKLYANYEDVVNEIHEKEFIGSGETFARYITAPIFKADMSLIDALGLANYALTITKQNVSSCGKRSDIVVIPKELGETVVMPHEKIRELEKTQALFHEHVQRMLFLAMVPDTPNEDLRAHIEVVLRAVEQIKERQKRNRDAYKEVG